MTQNSSKTEKRSKTEGGKILPALCSVLGTLMLVLVILIAVPMAVPRLMGYQVYSVISGSMEPALPVGSAVYVKETDPFAISPGDIVAYSDKGVPVTHRVIENRAASHELITRGDANPTEDLFPVPYINLLGQVKASIPVLGSVMMHFSDNAGKLFLTIFAFCGLVLRVTGSILRERTKNASEAKKTAKNEKNDLPGTERAQEAGSTRQKQRTAAPGPEGEREDP